MSTRVTNKSYGSKIGDSFKGLIGGFFAIIIAIGLLWWNESNSVKEIAKIGEGKKNTVEINAQQVINENEGKLVHLAGKATTNDTLIDEEFGFKVNAIHLNKKVEMFQYKENKETEEKENLGGGSTITETFTYEKIWSDDLIDSDNFYEKDKVNPSSFQHFTAKYYADKVNLEAFNLSSSLIRKINDKEAFPITNQMYSDTSGNSVLKSGVIYFSNQTSPEIGDERISYSVIYPKEISVIAQQKGSSFIPYKSKNGRTIELVSSGMVSADEMYIQEEQKNKIFTWILRFVGFLLMFGGFTAILKPLSTIGSVVPLFGKVVGAGTTLIAGILAFTISITIIAIAWIFYRPLLGVALLIIAIAAFYFGKKMFKKETPQIENTNG